ncbi:MAG TPA: class I SAM-dependent RNA methyltransferase [Candidatus Acidoferrales bacterium]|nr:class I SAM-dependent RNA methyltransferase [Candidatus Acidoferrales bacterium]
MEITIEKLIYGGEGLAHHDGSTVFVPFVLPAERIAAALVEQKKKFIRARVERLLEPSPDRASARCPHFGVCGGCDYQHIPYESQLKYKTEILRETLRRIGRIDWPGEITAHASPPWAYRNRAQWKVRPLGEDGVGGTSIGYFRANSTALCAVEDCAILSPLLLKTLLALRTAAAAGMLPRELREIEAFGGGNDSKLLVTATFAGFPARAQELVDKLRGILPEIESLLFHDPTRGRMELDGPGYIECEAAGATYRVGHFSFFQVNRFLVGELARAVAEDEAEGRLALDLFAGVGLFCLPLAKRFARVVAVESNPAAARDLEANTSGRVARGSRVIEVRSADVEEFLAKLKEKPELVVLDPPRAGLTPGTIKHLARMGPARITYVSCDPPTLARDLAALANTGYDIAGVYWFDLFPQTFHMETVVRLRRRP